MAMHHFVLREHITSAEDCRDYILQLITRGGTLTHLEGEVLAAIQHVMSLPEPQPEVVEDEEDDGPDYSRFNAITEAYGSGND